MMPRKSSSSLRPIKRHFNKNSPINSARVTCAVPRMSAENGKLTSATKRGGIHHMRFLKEILLHERQEGKISKTSTSRKIEIKNRGMTAFKSESSLPSPVAGGAKKKKRIAAAGMKSNNNASAGRMENSRFAESGFIIIYYSKARNKSQSGKTACKARKRGV